MSEVSIEVSGDMSPSPTAPKSTLASFFQSPMHLPDARTWLATQRQNVRPWLLFLQTSNFKVPPSVPRLSKRVIRNIEYFQSNYVFVFLGLLIYCLVTSPLLLLALVFTLYGGYKLSQRHQSRKFVLLGKELSIFQVYGILWLCAMPVFYIVGATTAVFWVIGASFTLIMLHASFYNIDAVTEPADDDFRLLQEV